ncbi:MAG: hypothetical protein Q9157_006075 [Trypethelium eluteriae]
MIVKWFSRGSSPSGPPLLFQIYRQRSCPFSSAAIPYLRTIPDLRLITISDSYPHSDLVAAFQGQDAVVSALTTLGVSEQFRFIDAAIEVGVKRFVASEYGLNNANPEARGLCSVFDDKGRIREYLREKEKLGLTWSSVSCGMWIAWAMQHKFLGVRSAEKKMIFWDDGKGLFSATTMDNTIKAVLNSLILPSEKTANRSIFIQDFTTSQAELLATIEKVSGEKWDVEARESEAIISDARKRVANGDSSANFNLIETGFVTGRYGGNLAEEGPLDNELLDLQPANLEDVVRQGLETFERTGYV